MYLRYTVRENDTEHGQPEGVFAIAYRLRDAGADLPEWQQDLIDTLRWFEKNLPQPPSDRLTDRALFWFRTEKQAEPCLQRIWTLIQLLRWHGFEVEEHRCRQPGSIIYSDAYQVAAIPDRSFRP